VPRKGEGIRILAPVTAKDRDENGDDTGGKRVFFKTVTVWDVSGTDPIPGTEPGPPTPPAEPITGNSHHHLITPLIAHAAELGYSVEIRDLPDHGPGGWCDAQRRQIVVASGPANHRVRTLTHELAHAHGVGYQQYTRAKAEVLVDCVTYCVLGSVGLDAGGESIPYIAGWGEDGALDAIRDYAQTIDTIARRIEDALSSEEKPSTEAVAEDAHAALRSGSGRARSRIAPMIGQVRPARGERHACPHRCTPAALTRVGAHGAPTPTQTCHASTGRLRRRGRPLPPTPARPPPCRRARRARAA